MPTDQTQPDCAKKKRVKLLVGSVVHGLMDEGKTNEEIAATFGATVKVVMMHRTAWKRARGLPVKKRTGTRGTLMERFHTRIDRNGPIPEHCPELGPCHVWTAGTDSGGYGMIHSADGKEHFRAHRMAYELEHGPIGDLFLLHKCDNRRCCNPAHLRPGTQLENIRDAIDKDRFRPKSPITIEIAREIKRRAAAGEKAATIAKAMGLPRDPVWHVVSGRTFKRVG